MTKDEAIKVYALIEEMTRAEIMARLGKSDGLDFADYYMLKLEKLDEIRKLIYGTDDLVDLGERWGLLKPRLSKDEQRRERKEKIKVAIKSIAHPPDNTAKGRQFFND